MTNTSKHDSVDENNDNSGESTLQSAGRLSRLTSLPAYGNLVDQLAALASLFSD